MTSFTDQVLTAARQIALETARRETTHLKWATVTGTSPVRIRYDGETTPSVVPPQTTTAGLTTGDRVVVVKQHGQAVLVGPPDGHRGISDGISTLQVGDDGAPRLYSDADLVFGRDYVGNAPDGSTNRLMVVTPVGTIGALADVIDHRYLPIRIAAGRVSIAAASNGIGSVSVTFPSGFFTSVPRMAVTADSAATTVVNTQFSGTTTSGTTLYLQRSNTINTGVEWVAVQT